MQPIGTPGNVERDDRCLVQRHEGPGGLVGLAGVHADVGTRQQGAQTGHRAARHARTDHPEAGVLHQQPVGLTRQLRRGGHMRPVFGQRHRHDLADIDILVLDARLARLQPGAAAELDGDGRSLFVPGARGEEGADQRRHQRNDPDQRHAEAPRCIDRGGGQGGRCRLSHGRRWCGRRAGPRSGGGRNSWRQTW
jgi:hypothetical protein